jgi:adenosylhomocysteine nucleosidase
VKPFRPAIVTALPEELAPLRSRVRDAMLGCTGDGPRCAAAGLAAFLDRFQPAEIIFLGIAGALSPELAVGDIIVGTEVHDAPAPDPVLIERALAIGGVFAGKIVSTERIATTAAEKTRLRAATGAAVVDLESASWARVAAARGVPFVIVRAVSDTATETLPIDFNRFMDEGGHVRRWRVALETLRHPRLIPELWRLRERVQLAAERLAGFTLDLFDGLPESPAQGV